VPVRDPLPVYLLYWTAFVDQSGAIQFREDVYGRDRRLAAALAGTVVEHASARALAPVGCPDGDGRSRR
jgi:murein L,D-transpeptidase YcbB/YkuD